MRLERALAPGPQLSYLVTVIADRDGGEDCSAGRGMRAMHDPMFAGGGICEGDVYYAGERSVGLSFDFISLISFVDLES